MVYFVQQQHEEKINTCDSNTRARAILVPDSLLTVFALSKALSSLVNMICGQ